MRRRRPAFSRTHHFAVALTTVVMSVGLPRAAATSEQVRVHGELGAEYDNNAHWAAQTGAAGSPPRVGSPLGRLVLGLTAADRLGTTQDVSFSILGAAKAFAAQEARNETVGVVETSGTWRIAVGERTRLALSGAYYEALQAGTAAERALSGVARDFRSLSPTFRVSRAVGTSGTAALAAGYRWFVYKPLGSYDFNAPVVALEYRLARETADGAAEWDVVATAGLELRRFAGTRLLREPGCQMDMCTAVTDPAGARHNDQFFAGRLEITRTGRVLLGVGYWLQWNRSNSYSETLLRHVGILRLTTPLPLGFYLAARAELVLVDYADRISYSLGPAGQSFATIDDENRSRLRAELSRDLTSQAQLIARYSLYLNAVGQGTYQRQTLSLSLSVTFD